MLHSFAFTKKDVLITNALVVLFYKMSIIVPEAILQLHMKGVFEHSMKAFALPFLSKDWSLLLVGLWSSLKNQYIPKPKIKDYLEKLLIGYLGFFLEPFRLKQKLPAT